MSADALLGHFRPTVLTEAATIGAVKFLYLCGFIRPRLGCISLAGHHSVSTLLTTGQRSGSSGVPDHSAAWNSRASNGVRATMSYRIEYLTETTDEDSICHAFLSKGSTLDDAQTEAFSQAKEARAKGATGFQIRHLNAVDVVVAIGEFSDATCN